jgi:hypothetical protein
MINGSLIEGLFAVVRKAEESARPALPEETQSREPHAELLVDFNDPGDDRGDDRREANSEAE